MIPLVLALVLARTPVPGTAADEGLRPEIVTVRSGALTLHALLWRPRGPGPFPAVLFGHGSYRASDPLPAREPEALGPVFARHGYAFLFPFRRGAGLSAAQGTPGGDAMARALAAGGEGERARVQLRLLEGDELEDARAGLAFLRALPDVDPARIAVAGHSFGGSLTLLLAEGDPALRAVLVFGGAAASWERSAALRERLLAAAGRISAPVLLVYAANDYSTVPGRALAAELRRLGKAHTLALYPAFGRSAREGHNLVYLGVPTWERDVFAFLDRHLRP